MKLYKDSSGEFSYCHTLISITKGCQDDICLNIIQIYNTYFSFQPQNHINNTDVAALIISK